MLSFLNRPAPAGVDPGMWNASVVLGVLCVLATVALWLTRPIGLA